jgi:hypothetical protein
MKDINSPLLKAYFSVINNLDIKVYEGEEPDNVGDKIYVVLSNITSNETSTKSSLDVNATIQVSVHSWEYKYNNSKNLNIAVGQILDAIKPSSNSVLDLSEFGLEMLNLTKQSDSTQNLGNLDGRVYISRILVFKQDIFEVNN